MGDCGAKSKTLSAANGRVVVPARLLPVRIQGSLAQAAILVNMGDPPTQVNMGDPPTLDSMEDQRSEAVDTQDSLGHLTPRLEV